MSELTNKYNRTNLYSVSNGSIDLTLNFDTYWNKNIEYERHSISNIEQCRPDLTSKIFYQTVDFWWIICKINRIEDIFNDYTVGSIISIPNISDIRLFYRNYKV